MPRALRFAALVLAATVLAAPACGRREKARAPVDPALDLYNRGRYAEALPLLAQARDGGRKDGTLLYQIGICRERVEGKPDARRAEWGAAEPLLEGEVGAPGGATLERLYYLTVINADQGEYDRMAEHGGRAVRDFERGPDPNALSGEDWFRLGRIHDFLQQPSEAEAAYRRALSAFSRDGEAHPTYHAFTLIKVADLDYGAGRYPAAADGYDRALGLLPETDQIRPFTHGLSLLAAGRFADAVVRFGADRDEDTATESQYGADLARKAGEVAPLPAADADGSPLGALPEEALAERIRAAARAFRGARDKHAWRPGDPLPAEVGEQQKRFVTLVRERLVRQRAIRDFCISEGIADLVRR